MSFNQHKTPLIVAVGVQTDDRSPIDKVTNKKIQNICNLLKNAPKKWPTISVEYVIYGVSFPVSKGPNPDFMKACEYREKYASKPEFLNIAFSNHDVKMNLDPFGNQKVRSFVEDYSTIILLGHADSVSLAIESAKEIEKIQKIIVLTPTLFSVGLCTPYSLKQAGKHGKITVLSGKSQNPLLDLLQSPSSST